MAAPPPESEIRGGREEVQRARQSRELALADRAVTPPSLLHSAQDPRVRPARLGENNRGKCLASSVVPPSSLICPAGLERDRPSVNVRRDRAFLHLCFLPLPILSSQEAVCAHSRNPRKEPHERQRPAIQRWRSRRIPGLGAAARAHLCSPFPPYGLRIRF